MPGVITTFAGGHDWRLVLLAVAVCALSSITAVSQLHRALTVRRDGFSRILGSGLILGFGIWALQNVAWMAYDPGTSV